MTDLNQIIEDVNVTIADLETLQISNDVSLPASQAIQLRSETKKAIGQMKAARASLIRANSSISIGVSQ